MNKKTLKALKGSIKKWESISRGTGSDKGSDNCPLCDIYLNQNFCCAGCPVMASTGQEWCKGSPYETQWIDLSDRDGRARSKRAKLAARAELKFLKSLLP